MNTSSQILIDLHLHTTCSDGVLSPELLFNEIRHADLSFFSITDHDTMASYPMPDDLKARAIAGIEVDSELSGRTVHLLAYGVDSESPLLNALRGQRCERHSRMEFIVAKLRDLGYPIELDDVLAQAGSASSLGRPHLARALMSRNIVSTVQEAFDRFLADDAPAFVPLQRFSAARIIELVHVSGALAVVAQPKRLRGRGDLTELVDLGADGIEIYHPSADGVDRTALCEFAKSRNLLTTGGTDFHSSAGDCADLGVSFDRRAMDCFISALAERR